MLLVLGCRDLGYSQTTYIGGLSILNDTATANGQYGTGGSGNCWALKYYNNYEAQWLYYPTAMLGSGVGQSFTGPFQADNGSGFVLEYFPCGYGNLPYVDLILPGSATSPGPTYLYTLSQLLQSIPGYATNACAMNTLTNFSYSPTPVNDKNDGTGPCEPAKCCGSTR